MTKIGYFLTEYFYKTIKVLLKEINKSFLLEKYIFNNKIKMQIYNKNT